MSRKSHTQRRRRHSSATGVTSFTSDFNYICKRFPNRIGIVSEGDSWFAYPRKWIALGADINIVHHIEDTIASTNTVNLLRLASNGDEAVNMISGKQKEKLERVFKQNADYIKLILFSGGGNDIVGKRDMLELLNPYETGFSAAQCINQQRFNRKLDAVMLAFDRLVDMRDEYAPKAKIVTHCYDIAKPSAEGAAFFWGLIKTKPWIYPYLQKKYIPEALHQPIVEILLGSLKTRLGQFVKEAEHHQKIFMVDTQGILRPGHKTDWLNEIHPTESGFKKIAEPIYAQMRQLEPDLPEWEA